jgi:outer membrane protein assembly factor BamB
MAMSRLFVMLAAAMASPLLAADWSEWRGPDRNGVIKQSPPLLDAWPAEGPKLVWTSEEKLPASGDYEGGWGSPVVANGRVYCSVMLGRKEEIATRTLTRDVLLQFGWSDKPPPAAALSAVEAARLSPERKALADAQAVAQWASKWLDANLDAEQRKAFGSLAMKRLTLGEAALDMAVLDRLAAVVDKPFADVAALDAWLDKNQVPDAARTAIKAKLPASERVCDNMLLCLDANTGKTVWKKVVANHYPAGVPGRTATAGSTPCVVNGRCYVIGMDGLAFCVDAVTGELVWQGKPSKQPTHASPVVVDGVAVIPAGPLTGYDAADGKVLWTRDEVAAAWASPVCWKQGDKTCVIVRSNGKIVCVAPKTGDLLWTLNEGGFDLHCSSSTPVVDGDRLAVTGAWGIRFYRLSAEKAELSAKAECPTGYGATPIIFGGHAYVLGAKGSSCVEVETGKIVWQDKALIAGAYGSPIAADGKLLVQGNKKADYGDGSLALFAVSPEKGQLLSQFDCKQTLTTTPAVSDGRVYCRLLNGLACYDLRK